MMSVFDDIVRSAIGIEAHRNRYEVKGEQVEATYVFSSAFRTEETVVPVLLEVREFKDDTKSTLRVAVTLHEIEKSRIVGHNTELISENSPYPLPAFNINIAKLFEDVNSADGRILKYIPDGFLNDEQTASKRAALRESAKEDYKRLRREAAAAKEETERLANEGAETEAVEAAYDNRVLVLESIEKESTSSSVVANRASAQSDIHPSVLSAISVAELYNLVNDEYKK